ncbi:MAG: membrane protein insertase YidC [Dehalococcoidales bacterium]|nr:membrane protein insertase YidC [Dehalococcoidales bacterium]
MNVWELIIQQPLTNVLIVVAHFFGDNFGVAIILLTILVNLALLPLTLSQIRSSKRMQDLQPKLAEIQKKYGKDRQKLAQEQMKIYKESGIKPAGCLLPMIIQMPVWFALYQSIMLALAAVPEGLLNLARYLYPWPVVFSSLPLNPYFLGMNLAQPNFILAILVGASMWIQQKMSATPTDDPRSAASSQMMTWMMPLLFAFLALSFPSGLSLYWIASSLIRIILQYRVTGWGTLRRKASTGQSGKKYVTFESEDAKKTTAKPKPKDEVIITDKESLEKSRKKPSRFSKFFEGRDDDEQSGE